VKQGGVLSPVLFSVYIDGLVQALSSSKIGSYIGGTFTGVLAYVDDIVLMVPSAHAMIAMLSICETYSKDFLIRFNASKSKCIVCTPQRKSWSSQLNKHVLFYLMEVQLRTCPAGLIWDT